MTTLFAILWLQFTLGVQPAQPTPPPTPDTPIIILPDVVAPIPKPPPQPVGTPIRLTDQTLYVVRANTPCIVLTSPEGILKTTPEAGPLVIRGIFVDGSGKPEMRKYQEKYVWLVEAAGSGTAEVIIIPVGATDEKTIVRRTIEANLAPQPPPIPPGPIPPGPEPPSPAPIPIPGFRVLIMYDKDTLTDAQQGIVFGRQVRDYLDKKCVTGADGKTPDRRIYPYGIDASGEAQWIRDVIQRHPGQKAWMVVSNGQTGYDGPLPATADEAMKILTKIGG